MVDKYKEVEGRLGYSFQDKSYLSIALTHRSASKDNNERLEYLGDSILSFVVSEYLYQRFPQATEGQLSRLRSSLVKGEMLTKIAGLLEIQKSIILSTAEQRTGGAQRPSILADAVEAIIAAVYLDSNDLSTCRSFILHWYKNFLTDLSLDTITKDPKTQLQEYLQAKRLMLPVYKIIQIKGEGHSQQFTVSCVIEELDKITQAEGVTRRKAEQGAAQKMMEGLK